MPIKLLPWSIERTLMMETVQNYDSQRYCRLYGLDHSIFVGLITKKCHQVFSKWTWSIKSAATSSLLMLEEFHCIFFIALATADVFLCFINLYCGRPFGIRHTIFLLLLLSPKTISKLLKKKPCNYCIYWQAPLSLKMNILLW